jgi:hypothetical protein
MTIQPSESHFDCAGTSLLGMMVKICARLDPTNYCHGGANDGNPCPPADCGAGVCNNLGTGTVDCAGGVLTNYDTLVQLDHNTNSPSVGGKPNSGFAQDPNCIATLSVPLTPRLCTFTVRGTKSLRSTASTAGYGGSFANITE